MSDAKKPVVIVLMGVSGCGKSTIGTELSHVLGWQFRDADSFHPPANIEKMSNSIPLIDEDRWPWLDAIGAWIDERLARREPGIVSCSALKRAYRQRIGAKRPGVRLVYLLGSQDMIASRLAARTGHFMPADLLASQFGALEEPGPGSMRSSSASPCRHPTWRLPSWRSWGCRLPASEVAASPEFLTFLRDQLAPLGHVTTRRMFSGAGVYCDGVIFALLLRDTLFFKVDDGNRAAYEAEGLQPFSYEAKGKTVVIGSYWRVPERLFDDPDEMLEWARAALAAGHRAERKKKPKRKG
jgi:gluconokinase